MEAVVLLNSDFTPLGVIGWKKAVKLIAKKKVEVVKYGTHVVSNFEKTVVITIPLIIRLVKLIRTLWGKRVPFSKRTVIIRDNFTCAYCGKYSKTGMTIDHIIPKAQGGKSTFDNVVSCCLPCNNYKDNKTPAQAKMYLKIRPTTPTIMEFIIKQIRNIGLTETLNELERLGVV